MRIRTASASALVAALAVALVAPAAAQAAPEPIAPRLPSSAAAPAATWAGLEPVTSDGSARVDVPITGPTSLDLRVHEPAGATGVVLDPALAGTVTLDVAQLAAGGAGSTGAVLTAWPESHGTAEPTGWPGANDTLTSAFSIDQRTQLWAFSYTFDFSGLAGGVLPAGSRIAAADVDVCGPAGSGLDERFVATSDASGAWLDYAYRVVRSADASSPPTVTFDAETGEHRVTPSCDDREMIEAFLTTQPLSTLTVDLANRQGLGITRFGLLLPTAAPAPALSIVKTTDGTDVTAAPGPRLAVGADVVYGFEVANTGTTALADVTVTDDRLDAASIDCGDGTNVVPLLAVGETVACTATGVVVEGQHANTASVTGAPVDTRGAPVAGAAAPTAQDSSWHVGVVVPAATVSTTTDVPEAQPGDAIAVTTVVENVGVAELDAVDLVAAVPEGITAEEASDGGTIDDGAVTWRLGPLAPGESATVTLVGTVTATVPGTALVVRTTGTAVAGEERAPLAPREACVDDAAAACAAVVVAAAPPSPAPSTPPSTTPGPGSGAAAGSGAGGTLPETGSDLAPLAWMAGMALLLAGLALVLRRRPSA